MDPGVVLVAVPTIVAALLTSAAWGLYPSVAAKPGLQESPRDLDRPLPDPQPRLAAYADRRRGARADETRPQVLDLVARATRDRRHFDRSSREPYALQMTEP